MKMKTVKNVPLLEVGVEYNLSTGLTTFTPDDLADMATAANEDPAIPSPRLKLGHIDPRYNDPKIYDGTPSFGCAQNLRLSENGMVLYADFEGVPGWLADIMPQAYPSRSVEVFWGVESQAGGKWRAVCSAVALLGVVWPGINQIEDLPLYYGDEMPPDVVIAEAVAASSLPGGDPMKTRASADLDDVRRAFYNEYLPSNADARWWWVRQVLTDPNQLVTEDDETGQLYLLPFSSDAEGNVTFGDADPVRVDYIPDNREAAKAAAPSLAAVLASGRTVLGSWPTRAASSPDNTGGVMDPKKIREALSLPEDASDEQVQAALLLKAGFKEDGTPVEPVANSDESNDDEGGEVLPITPAKDEQTPAPVAVAASTGLKLPPGTVLIDEATWKQTQAGLSRVNDLVARQEKGEVEGLVSAAIGDGRIPPARKEHWISYITADREGGEAALASLKPNIVPLEERGHANTGDQQETLQAEAETVAGWSADLFPEVRNQRARDAASAAAGGNGLGGPRQRIMSDGKYTR